MSRKTTARVIDRRKAELTYTDWDGDDADLMEHLRYCCEVAEKRGLLWGIPAVVRYDSTAHVPGWWVPEEVEE